MSKIVRGIIGVGPIVAGFFMGGSTWPLAVKALGAGLLSSATQPKLKIPKTSSETSARLNKNLDPEAHRKIVFGRTAAPSDIRYWEVWGQDQSRYDEVIAVATHRIHGYGPLYIEDELVTFSGSAAQGKWLNVLGRNTRTAGGDNLTIGTGTRWTTATRMAGCAYYAFRWQWSQEKLPRGFPTRITQIIEGALVYDPRRDSTRGGNGPHRANDAGTWTYDTADSNGQPIGRNPALQILWYLIGWRINGVLVAGQGIPLEDIDFSSFIEAANRCEEEGYYSDCALSTGDSHQTNLSVLESACAGEVDDTGGLMSLRIAVDDLDGTLTDFNDGDVVGECSWKPKRPLAQFYNQVEGQFVDPDALYQRRSYPVVRDEAYEFADGRRIRTALNFDAVQDHEQAQKLARLHLNRSRLQGVFEAPFSWKAVNVQVGDPVTLTLSRYGFSAKIMRVTGRKVDPGGAVWLSMEEDDPQVYAGGTVEPLAPPGAGAGYDTGFVPTPGADEWEGTGGSIGTPVGVEKPAIIVETGAPHPPNITGILVYHRRFGLDPVDPWTFYAEYPPDTTQFRIDGLLANTQYQVRILYRNQFGVIDPTAERILGPFTTGGEVASDALIPSQAIADAVAAINDALGSAYETLAQAQAALAALGLDASLPSSSLLNWISDPMFALGVEGWRAHGGAGFEAASDPKGFHAVWTFPASGADAAREIAWPERRPIREAGWVQCAADVAVSGVVTEVHHFAVFEDEAGAEVGRVALSSGSSGRVGGVGEAPEGAAFVRIVTQPDASGAGEGAVTLARPLAAYALPGQLEPNAWTDPSNEIVAAIGQLRRALGNEAKDVRTLEVQTRDARAGIRRVDEAVVEEASARATAITQLGAQFTTALNETASGLQAQITSRATITYVDDAVATETAARTQAIAAFNSTVQADYLSKADAQAIYYTEAQVNSAIAGFNFSALAYFDGLEASVTSQGVAISDLNTRTAAHFTEVTAGAAFAGVAVTARDSNGNVTAQIRFAAQIFAWGLTYNAPFFVIDAVNRRVEMFVGAQMVWQLNTNTGQFRRWLPNGTLIEDSAQGGLLMAALAPVVRTQGPARTTSITGSGVLTESFATVAEVNLSSLPGEGRFVSEGVLGFAPQVSLNSIPAITNIEYRVIAVQGTNEQVLWTRQLQQQLSSSDEGSDIAYRVYTGPFSLDGSAIQNANQTGSVVFRVQARRTTSTGAATVNAVDFGVRRQP